MLSLKILVHLSLITRETGVSVVWFRVSESQVFVTPKRLISYSITLSCILVTADFCLIILLLFGGLRGVYLSSCCVCFESFAVLISR